MKRLSILVKVTCSIIVTITLMFGLNCSIICKKYISSQCPMDSGFLIVTEICPSPVGEAPPWIELYNPHEKNIHGCGFKIVIGDTFHYSLPRKLPPVPPKGFIIFQLDGKGEKANLYEYKEKVVVLHSPPGFEKALGLKSGQIAIYKKSDKAADKLISFVSWGAPGSKKSLTLERHRIWKSRWFVPTASSFGDLNPNAAIRTGFSIGLYPDSKTMNQKDWVIYSQKETTAGKKNVVPRPMMFTLSNGAVVRSEDIAVGWVGNKYAKEYRFQVAKDSDFTSIIESKTLGTPFYKPGKVLPEGVYYYRIKIIDKNGRESAWSDTMKLVSKKLLMRRIKDRADRVIAEKILTAMIHKYQRKDTNLLCLDGCASDEDGTTVKHWDNAHPDAEPDYGDHGDMNCVRASISMMVSYYGKSLSQDRIAYFTEEEKGSVGDGIPEGDLAHSVGMSYSAEETDALEWALDETTDFYDLPNPTFTQLRTWLDADRPIMTRTPGHLRTMNGYIIDDDSEEWVQILDPWSGSRWETYTSWEGAARGTWVGPVSAPNARDDESSIWTDTDNDGVMDFDEQIRFLTGRFDKDSDNDDVHDKNDIREYVFNTSDAYSKRDADFDINGVRKEKDPDNDGDTYNDGCEDQNFNGKYEPADGETDNFNDSDPPTDPGCPEKPIHAMIVFDRSGSMAGAKYDEAASSAVLFLDTWLANSPPTNTKVGLVFFDCDAHYDTGASTNTTLDMLTTTKRDMINDAFPLNMPDYGATSIGGGILKAMDSNGFDIASIPAEDQHRVIVVLTDGMENCGTRMDDPSVIQDLADGQVDGYVLGIGDETQIDMDKLNDLADILNHYPASFAKDLDSFELEKFFLQVLAETQGLEFSVDPVYEIAMGRTKCHRIPVSRGTERATFVVVWNTPNVTLSFKLLNPLGIPVKADVKKTNTFYQISAKNSPMPGKWTVTVYTKKTGEGDTPQKVPYALMALEKNDQVHSHFEIKGGLYQTGQPLLLVANLSKKKIPLLSAEVRVEVTKPAVAFGQFVADTQVKTVEPVKPIEKDIKMTPLQMKYMAMAKMKLQVPTTRAIVTLNDSGENGDEIPGDGKYSGYFKDTTTDGIYSFRFITRSVSKCRKFTFTREKAISVLVRPKKRTEK